MTYEDLREHGSESAVKAAGKLHQQGKGYESERTPTSFPKEKLTAIIFQWSMAMLRIGSREPNLVVWLIVVLLGVGDIK